MNSYHGINYLFFLNISIIVHLIQQKYLNIRVTGTPLESKDNGKTMKIKHPPDDTYECTGIINYFYIFR